MDYTIDDLLELTLRSGEDHSFYMRKIYEAVKKEREEYARVAQESNLYRHAKRELERIGEDPEFIEAYLDIITKFAIQGHSGGSASVFIPTLNKLLNFKPLTPLTNDPEEWMCISGATSAHPGGLWQNRRDSEAFSENGGNTYYLISEVNGHAEYPIYTSEKHV